MYDKNYVQSGTGAADVGGGVLVPAGHYRYSSCSNEKTERSKKSINGTVE